MTAEDTSDPNAGMGLPLESPVFLHDKEVEDAVRVVTLIASGRNPFSDQPFDKLRPEQKDTIMQALCVVISALADKAKQSTPVAQPWMPSADAAAREATQPLDKYLEQIERDAILKALTETKYNRTAAARLLGITFRALRYRMETLGLEENSD